MFNWARWAVLGALVLGAGATFAETAIKRFGFGRAATAEEIAGWNIDIDAEGLFLPPGAGTVAQGEAIYEIQCAKCHGEFGEGSGLNPALAGGKGSLATPDPVKTVGSFWPYAPPLFDYVRRTMPFTAPLSLTAEETYALVGYVLHLNDLLPAEAKVDAAALRALRMPNRDGFVVEGDRRQESATKPCMVKCRKEPPRVISASPPPSR
ncbi:MAG: cytochrome c [Alphaproteobacteria bacterium]|nr:cytochrome c [Alphaproteobacteria bacterium]